MLLQKENGKHYLYVQQAAKQGFMVVDVSDPEKPSLLKRTAESNQSTSGNPPGPTYRNSCSTTGSPSPVTLTVTSIKTLEKKCPAH